MHASLSLLQSQASRLAHVLPRLEKVWRQRYPEADTQQRLQRLSEPSLWNNPKEALPLLRLHAGYNRVKDTLHHLREFVENVD